MVFATLCSKVPKASLGSGNCTHKKLVSVPKTQLNLSPKDTF